MIETIIMGRVAKISFEVLYSIKLARSGAYERALDTLKSADIIHGIIILIVKGKKMLKGDIGALLRKYSDSKFAKLYIMAELFKEFRGIFVIENPIDSGKNYMNEALYIDKKFPKEYERIMGLTIVIDGFKKLDTQVKNVFILNYKDNKNRNKASGFYPFNDRHQKLHIDLTHNGSFDFGNTNLRADIKKQRITRKNGKTIIRYDYNVYMYEYFEKPLGDTKPDFGRRYIMRTTPIPRTGKVII